MNRLDYILNMVSQYEKIDVTTLAEELKVSKVTIRKDLDKLEERGLLHREHGYAVLNSGDNLNVRLSFHHAIKRKISLKAVEFVQDNDTIIIESGSTCTLLAEAVCQKRRNVTIITNSCFIADYLKDYDSCKVLLLGGEYQKNSQVTVGPLLKKMLGLFQVNAAFIGTDGFDDVYGFTGKDLMRTEVAQAMAASANEVIILTDSSKFTKRGVVSQFHLGQVTRLITDDGIPQVKEKILEGQGILIEKV